MTALMDRRALRVAFIVAIACLLPTVLAAAWQVRNAAAADAASRASIHIEPGTISASDIAVGAVGMRHLSRSTVPTFIGAGAIEHRPRALPATKGWLYFARDVDGGALFRSAGDGWEQLTPGRLGHVARNSLDSSRIKPKGISGSRLADRAVTSRVIAMDAWRAISSSGPITDRPAPEQRPAGSFWFAPDVLGGSLYQNDGEQWQHVSSLGAEARITPGAITTDLLAEHAVTTEQLAPGSVTSSVLADGAVTGVHVAPGSIELSDIDPAVWSDRIATGPLAARPAAAPSNANSLYFASDDAGGTLARSDGSAWMQVGRTRSPRTVGFTSATWTNMPAALTEYLGANRSRTAVDLSTATEVRLVTSIVTVGSGMLCAHYSIDDGATWSNFDGSAGSGCVAGVVSASVAAPTGLKVSAWMGLPAAARSEEALVRLVSIGGNGVLDPVFGVTAVELR